ncbi:MAG: glycosyltransferase [Candidatus Marinimicrobia bacterium]|nr:glycosyltransferase [Candidatus Neomarinimicrobiota bacterium]
MLTQKLNVGDNRSLLISGVPEEDEKAYEDAERNYGVNPINVKELRRTPGILKEIMAIVKIFKIINKSKPDVVHTHHAKAGTLGRVAAKVLGVRIRIHTFHGHVLSGYFSENVTKLVILAERFLAKISTSIITISAEQFEDIVHRYRIAPECKTTIIPLGFDFKKMVSTNKNKGLWRQKLGIEKSTVCIGFVGRLAPIKNVTFLIDAYAEYLQINRDSSLWIIGDGPEKELLKSKIFQKEMVKNVHFLGWQTNLSEIYNDLDVLALTSLNEGTPVAIIEALSHGVPVVSTNVGGVKSIIALPEMGRVVDGFDPMSFSQSLEETVKIASISKKSGKQWYDEMYQRYSSDRLIEDIRNLYATSIE